LQFHGISSFVEMGKFLFCSPLLTGYFLAVLPMPPKFRHYGELFYSIRQRTKDFLPAAKKIFEN